MWIISGHIISLEKLGRNPFPDGKNVGWVYQIILSAQRAPPGITEIR